jgi:hypothetical protein
MGLFGKRRNQQRLESVGDGFEGTAVIRASEPASGRMGSREGAETVLDLSFNVVGTRAYTMTLEVRLPGREPYAVSDVFDVPKKAENLNFFDTQNMLKPGIELPVRVDAADAAKVAVDWDRFLADPGRKKSVRAAKEAGQRANVAKEVAKNPKKQAKMWANNRMAVEGWVWAVQAGQMTRAEFDTTVTAEVESGRMDPADAEAARQVLDAG